MLAPLGSSPASGPSPKASSKRTATFDPRAPRLVGRVLATTSDDVPWHRVVRADGTVPKGRPQVERLQAEQVPMRGTRVDLRHARWPGELR
jgi:methylated-DNA-protein-cysteine methyltransferase-like protein